MSVIFPLTLVTLTCTGPKPDSTESPVFETPAAEDEVDCDADGAGVAFGVATADGEADADGAG